MSERLCVIADDPYAPTGFATVMRNIVKRICSNYKEVVWISWGNKAPHLIGSNIVSLSIGNVNQLSRYIMRLKPDKIFSLHAYWGLRAVEKIPLVTDKILFYLVIDLKPIPVNMRSVLKHQNRIIVPSRYSQKIASEAGLDVGYVPHGVDLDLFTPIESVYRDRDDSGLFKFLILQKNNVRKQIARGICAFSRANVSNKEMLLVTQPRVPLSEEEKVLEDSKQAGGDLLELVVRYNIDKQVKWHELASIGCPIPIEEMPLIYNQCHVNVYSGCGESGGLPFLESLACGIPNIATDVGAGNEYIKHGVNGFLVPVRDIQPLSTGDLPMIDIDECARYMEKISDLSVYRQLAGNARDSVREYSWDNITPLIQRELDNL